MFFPIALSDSFNDRPGTARMKLVVLDNDGSISAPNSVTGRQTLRRKESAKYVCTWKCALYLCPLHLCVAIRLFGNNVGRRAETETLLAVGVVLTRRGPENSQRINSICAASCVTNRVTLWRNLAHNVIDVMYRTVAVRSKPSRKCRSKSRSP